MSEVGRIWKSESSSEADAVSGVQVRRLTWHKGHSHHLYFTNPGWWDGGKRMLFGSDRGNRTNLFSVELASGEITQLTDLPEGCDPQFLFSSVNPVRSEVYFWLERVLQALDLKTLSMRPIYRTPDGMSVNMTNVSADGKFVYTGIYEDLSKKFKVDLLNGYVGFAEYHAAKPLSQIIEISTGGAGSRVTFEENYWIGHVNTSPTQPHLLSYCHEGPWGKVDQRIWGLDVRTGKSWKIRPIEPDERISHEYWLADGLSLGFHGETRLGKGQHTFGFIRYDNTEHVEAPFPTASWHFFSNDRELLAGDGSTKDAHVYLWRFRDGVFSRPRILCKHRGSFHIQQTHVHPRFSADRKHLVFTSDRTGYGNVYLAEVPDFESLPEAPEKK